MKRREFVICSICLALFLIISSSLIFDFNHYIDDNIYNVIRKCSSSGFDTFFISVTYLGNTLTICGIVLIFLVIYRNRYGILLTVSTGISVVSNLIIKSIIKRSRPDHVRLIVQGGYSFPSGHSMISIAVYGFLLYFSYRFIKNRYFKIIVCMLLFLIIILIGISRIYVGVHYPTDVLAGYCLSMLELVILIAVSRKYVGENNEKDGCL